MENGIKFDSWIVSLGCNDVSDRPLQTTGTNKEVIRKNTTKSV